MGTKQDSAFWPLRVAFPGYPIEATVKKQDYLDLCNLAKAMRVSLNAFVESLCAPEHLELAGNDDNRRLLENGLAFTSLFRVARAISEAAINILENTGIGELARVQVENLPTVEELKRLEPGLQLEGAPGLPEKVAGYLDDLLPELGHERLVMEYGTAFDQKTLRLHACLLVFLKDTEVFLGRLAREGKREKAFRRIIGSVAYFAETARQGVALTDAAGLETLGQIMAKEANRTVKLALRK